MTVATTAVPIARALSETRAATRRPDRAGGRRDRRTSLAFPLLDDSTQLELQITRGLPTLVRILSQASVDDMLESVAWAPSADIGRGEDRRIAATTPA